MSFEIGHQIIDHDDGATLRTTFAHLHATHTDIGIFDKDSRIRFKARFRSYSVDVPPDEQDIDPPGQITLLDAWSYDAAGHKSRVTGTHPDLMRMLDYYQRFNTRHFNNFRIQDLRK